MPLETEVLLQDELKSIKEAVAMTKLGQMIWNDALEKGREEGEKVRSVLLTVTAD